LFDNGNEKIINKNVEVGTELYLTLNIITA
jgi:hypothetical protein